MTSIYSILAQENAELDLIELLSVILSTTCSIAERISRGALGDTLGATAQENVQGEVQKKLDVIANDLLINALINQGSVRAIASEEETHTLVATAGAPYLVAFDPLDGSTNIDINAPIGTIFTIFNARDDVPDAREEQFYQSGSEQVCAGYVLYGPYTTLMITTGKTTHDFTLNKTSGEFVLSKSPVVLPDNTLEFAANLANQFYWPKTFQDYIATLIAKKIDTARFNMRWLGAMVGDVHRILTRGGVFIYPSDCRNPKQPAKLRLLYEAFPMALLIEAAGGQAYSESGRILEAELESLHQRTPVILGDKKRVDECFSTLCSTDLVLT